jgi:cathepsin D
VAVQQTTQGLLQGSVSGIFGLAFSAIANTKAIPFWQALATGGQLTTPEMGFWLTRSSQTNTQKEVPGGAFTLGGTNSSLFTGDIEFLNMPGTTPTFWLLTMQSESESSSCACVGVGVC